MSNLLLLFQQVTNSEEFIILELKEYEPMVLIHFYKLKRDSCISLECDGSLHMDD